MPGTSCSPRCQAAAAPRLSRRERCIVQCLAGANSQAPRVRSQRSISRRSPQPRGSGFQPDKGAFLTGGAVTAASPLPAAPPPLPLELELQGLSPLEAQKRLTGRVKAARSLADFAAVINAGGRLVDAICLVAILSGLPRAVQRAALPVLTTHSSSSGAGAGGGAARAGGAGGSGSGGASGAGVQLQLPEQEARELAALAAGVVGLVRLRLREFDLNGLVTVTVGLAKLGGYVPVEAGVFRTILTHLEPRLPGLGTKALANLMWALATAGVQPCGSWLSRYYAAVERQLEEGAWGGGDLANLLWGLAKFDLMPEVWLMDQLAAACLAQLQRSHCAADGATALTCLARYSCTYNYRLPDEVLGAFLAALQPGLRAAAPGDLVAIVHSAVCMSHMPSRPFMLEFYGAVLERLAPNSGATASSSAAAAAAAASAASSAAAGAGGADAAVLRGLAGAGAGVAGAGGGGLRAGGELSGADFSRLLWSLSRVDCTPPRSWLREFVEVATPKLSGLRHRALSELVWALAVWDAKPSGRFLDEFYRVSARRLHEYPPAQIADTLSALSKLGCRAPAPWLGGMLAAFCASLLVAQQQQQQQQEGVGAGAGAGAAVSAAAAVVPEVRSHELVAVLEAAVDIAEDRMWLGQPQQRRLLQLLADTAASKFAVFDAVSHSRLVLALARANLCPGAAWLAQQQASLANAWRSDGGADIDTATAAGLRQAYRAWDVELDSGLAAELEGLGLQQQ
ncbi:hypothetical protein HYH02_000025 [Chlamydomonas schloesseri]|uniref:Uncharacterized protein n=1 Tax=Chlamydomonas schloesseri TaxID=2026947 RepID=A0A835WLZ4_9CHLO|nr:hypothetical protein HYH02_000025 [Chlamydomonas schloesseri]|eukprot:KAG2449920.1 hypothetical protein HYH02_000025 [Chlamydomonas schloesseri]